MEHSVFQGGARPAASIDLITVFTPWIPEEGAEPVEEYQLERVPLDLTRHWMTKYPTGEPAKDQLYSLRSFMPAHTHAFRTAIGDLNGDQVDEYVFFLEDDIIPDPDDNVRDLQIVFTTYGGFQQKLYLPGFFPGRAVGGFFDPIGKDCCSGIFISGDTLIVGLFGGSAWQWQTRRYYRYSEAQGTFFSDQGGVTLLPQPQCGHDG